MSSERTKKRCRMCLPRRICLFLFRSFFYTLLVLDFRAENQKNTLDSIHSAQRRSMHEFERKKEGGIRKMEVGRTHIHTRTKARWMSVGPGPSTSFLCCRCFVHPHVCEIACCISNWLKTCRTILSAIEIVAADQFKWLVAGRRAQVTAERNRFRWLPRTFFPFAARCERNHHEKPTAISSLMCWPNKCLWQEFRMAMVQNLREFQTIRFNRKIEWNKQTSCTEFHVCSQVKTNRQKLNCEMEMHRNGRNTVVFSRRTEGACVPFCHRTSTQFRVGENVGWPAYGLRLIFISVASG